MTVFKNRNELLYQLRMQRSMSAKRFATFLDVPLSGYVDLENGRISPLSDTKKKWKPNALKIAENLSMLVEDLWPEEAKEIRKASALKEAGAVQAYLQSYDSLQVRNPEEILMDKELVPQVDRALRTLTPVEEYILRSRFGLDDHTMEGETLAQIATRHDVARQTIMQKEARALRKLRHPARSKKLREWVEDVDKCNYERVLDHNGIERKSSKEDESKTNRGIWGGHEYIPYNASDYVWKRGAERAIEYARAREYARGQAESTPHSKPSKPVEVDFATKNRLDAVRPTGYVISKEYEPSKIEKLVAELVMAKRTLSHPLFKTGDKRAAIQKRICDLHMAIRKIKNRPSLLNGTK